MQKKSFGVFVGLYGLFGLFGLLSAPIAFADNAPIGKFAEVAPDSYCTSGEGAAPRAAGTIFRGAHPDADGLKLLAASYSIAAIDNLEDGSAPQEEVALIKTLGLSILELLHPLPQFGVIKLANGQYDHDAMIAAVGELRKSSQFPLFVHCTHGEDRTGMVIALHRVFNECWSPAAATAEWESMQEAFGNELQDKMHDYFEDVTQSAQLSAYYSEQLAKIQ